jgi:hypothetical protein
LRAGRPTSGRTRSPSAWRASLAERHPGLVTTEWLKKKREDVTPGQFGMREALERVDQYGDLFAPVLRGGQALGRAFRKLP